MKRRNKLTLGIIGLATVALFASGCTANFCTPKEKSRIAYALEPGVSQFVNARKKGEYSKSFAAVMIMYIIVATVCWGFLGQRLLGIACILAWGPGDAAAALIGQRFGKHKIGRRKRKSLEGSLAMFVFSFISVLVVLFIYGRYGVVATVIVALMTALASTITELLVENGFDTFYCPVAAMVVIVISEMLLR